VQFNELNIYFAGKPIFIDKEVHFFPRGVYPFFA